MKILIKSATIIAPSSKYHNKTLDILIENGTIKAIEKNIPLTENTQEVTYQNLHLSLGWIDSSVSFGEPGYEDRETLYNGMQTAAKSGYTSIGLNATSHPAPDTGSSISYLKNKTHLFGVELFPIGNLTKNGAGKDLAELYDMQQHGAISFYDYKQPIQNPNLLKLALQYTQGFNGLVQSFPQENAIARTACVNENISSTNAGLSGIPNLAEELQIARDLYILKYTGGKLHIPTISTASSVNLIKQAKLEGLDVSCSVAIANLYYTDKEIIGFDSAYKVLPPLRTEEDRLALLAGIKDGTIDMVTTDHFPTTIEEKKVEFEQANYGSIGLECAFGILNKLVGTEKAIDLLTKGRTRFGITEPKLEVGEKAEISLFSPTENYTFTPENILSSSKNTIFKEEKLTGKAIGIFANNSLTLN